MSAATFLDLPLAIRHQIYTDLLVPSLTQNVQGQLTHTNPTTSILYVNRAIYDEASLVFYARNLFVVIHASDPTALSALLTQHKTHLFTTVKTPATIPQCPRFALSIHLNNLKTLLPACSTPTYVVTAEALPYFFAALASPPTTNDPSDASIPNPFTKPGGIATFKTLNSFGYTPSRFSDLTFGRLATLPCPPVLTALRITGVVAPLHYTALLRWCEDATAHTQAHLFPWCMDLALGIYVRDTTRSYASTARVADAEELSAAFDIFLTTVDMYWECFDFHHPHPYHNLTSEHQLRDNSTEDGQRIVDVDVTSSEEETTEKEKEGGGEGESAARIALYDTLLAASNAFTRHLFLLAKQLHPSSSSAYIHARTIAETALTYLNRPDRCMRLVQPEPAHPNQTNPRGERVEAVTPQNALLSLKAAKASAKLGDLSAAETYLKDARDTGFFVELVNEKLADLKDGVEKGFVPDVSGESRGAILWSRGGWKGGGAMSVDSPEFKRCCMLLERRCVVALAWRSMPLYSLLT